MKKIVQLLAVAIALTSFGFAAFRQAFLRFTRTKRAFKLFLGYALFDLMFGGFCGGFFPMPLLVPQARAQNGTPPYNPQFPNNVGGQFIASEYGKWTLQSLTTSGSTGAYSISLNPCYVNVGTGNKRIFPIAVNVPVTVIDGSQTETVTPTAVTFPTAAVGPSTGPNPYQCSFTATFTYAHSSGVFIVSGDSGLEEAINDALVTGSGGGSAGSGYVILDSSWGGTTSTLTSAIVYPTVQIVDLRSNHLSYWNPQPNSQSTIAAPTVRAGVATCPSPLLATTVCSVAAPVGTWPNSPEFVCVTYIDVMGGESPCSTTTSFTPTGTTSSLFFNAPAASTGAVGWRAYAGLAYLTTAYQLPITSANCTLTTIETTVPACALTNATYGQVGSNGTFSTPTVHTSLVPQAGGVAAAYNPNPISHQGFSYAPAAHPYVGFEQAYGPFPTSVALTAGQLGVLGSVVLPPAYLNYIGETIVLRGKVAFTPTTTGTAPQINIAIGDITDFTTGTPNTACKLLFTQATTGAAQALNFECRLQTNTTGTTGSIMPAGHAETILTASTTLGAVTAESSTGALTADVLDPDTLFVVFLQASSAETTGPTLLSLNIDVL